MAPKKKGKKKGGKGKKKSSNPEDEEKKQENEELKVDLPKFGWVKITVSSLIWTIYRTCDIFTDFVGFIFWQLNLVNSPTPEINRFDVFMLTSQKVFMVKKKIVDHHGRVENVKLFNTDPTPARNEARRKEEERAKAIKDAEKAKALAEETGEDE